MLVIASLYKNINQFTLFQDISILIYLLYGTTALEELLPPSNEGFFI